ncbi:MAG: nucleotidyltransferase [Actinobacteria bacterium]|nr:nucleotidyltransferase [Actinomycetota bacterium]
MVKIHQKKLTTEMVINLLQNNKNTLEKYTVKKIGLFGSFAKNKQDENSDMDFIVEFRNPDLDNFMDLVNFLEKLFNRKVEILTPVGLESIRIKEVAENIKKSVIYV